MAGKKSTETKEHRKKEEEGNLNNRGNKGGLKEEDNRSIYTEVTECEVSRSYYKIWLDIN